MALKPEVIGSRRIHLFPKAKARALKTAKKAVTRLMRRSAKQNPESAPNKIRGGYID